MSRSIRYLDLASFIEANGLRKGFVAAKLGVPAWRLSELLNPKKYAPQVTTEEVNGIAALLNQPTSYVRKIYAKAA